MLTRKEPKTLIKKTGGVPLCSKHPEYVDWEKGFRSTSDVRSTYQKKRLGSGSGGEIHRNLGGEGETVYKDLVLVVSSMGKRELSNQNGKKTGLGASHTAWPKWVKDEAGGNKGQKTKAGGEKRTIEAPEKGL